MSHGEESLIFGLIAKKGAGKTTFTNVARKVFGDENTLVITSGDMLGERLKRAGKPVTDENKQDLYIGLKKTLGEDFIAQEVKTRIEKSRNKFRCIIWDGVRLPHDVRVMQSLGGILVFIVTSMDKRYERRRMRTTKEGEKNLSWEQFLKEEEKETEQQIADIGIKYGKFLFANDGTLEQFERQVGKFLRSL